MKRILIAIVSLVLLSSCKKFLTAEMPGNQLVSVTVFTNDQTAIAAQLAIYARMEGDGLAYQQILNMGLSADEYTNYSTAYFNIDIVNNNVSTDNGIVLTLWTNYYKYIYQANAVLEGVAKSETLSDTVRTGLEGEARFVRAYCYYYLCTLFGDVPLVTGTDYRVNAQLARSPLVDILNFIKEDLETAIPLLPVSYFSAGNTVTTEKVRPNRYAAQTLLSRAYLISKQWDKAEAAASSVIAGNFQLLTNLDAVFLKNSAEAIWQYQSVVPGYNTYPGAQLILTTTPNLAALDTQFVKQFTSIDKRKASWIKSITVAGRTYYYSNKYKVKQSTSISEYSMVFRLPELYLIRAEARQMQGNLPGAEQDLNTVRLRAGLSALSGLTPEALFDSIQKERRLELFSESGDRWLNLKRTGQVDNILSQVKGSNWSSTDALYPIPLAEITRNNRLTQNAGY